MRICKPFHTYGDWYTAPGLPRWGKDMYVCKGSAVHVQEVLMCAVKVLELIISTVVLLHVSHSEITGAKASA